MSEKRMEPVIGQELADFMEEVFQERHAVDYHDTALAKDGDIQYYISTGIETLSRHNSVEDAVQAYELLGDAPEKAMGFAYGDRAGLLIARDNRGRDVTMRHEIPGRDLAVPEISVSLNYAEKYLFEKHVELDKDNPLVGEGVPFERIRRITGYLVGSMDRFNNAKRAEIADRVPNNVGATSIPFIVTDTVAESLAQRIDDFMYGFDPYEYRDRVDDREAEVAEIKVLLKDYGVSTYLNELRTIYQNADSDLSQGDQNKLFSLIQDLTPYEVREMLIQKMRDLRFELTHVEGLSEDFLMWKNAADGKVFGLDGWDMVKDFIAEKTKIKNVVHGILYEDKAAVLERDDVILTRSSDGDDTRIEVHGEDLRWFENSYPEVVRETVNFHERYFVPTGTKGEAVLEKLLTENPLRSLRRLEDCMPDQYEESQQLEDDCEME